MRLQFTSRISTPHLSSTDGEPWFTKAACGEYPPELWDISSKLLDHANLEALRICDGCPVRETCARELGQGFATITGGQAWNDKGERIPRTRVKREAS